MVAAMTPSMPPKMSHLWRLVSTIPKWSHKPPKKPSLSFLGLVALRLAGELAGNNNSVFTESSDLPTLRAGRPSGRNSRRCRVGEEARQTREGGHKFENR